MLSRFYSVLKGWKTFLFGTALILLALLEQISMVDIKTLFPQAWVPAAIGITINILRVVTTTKAFKRE